MAGGFFGRLFGKKEEQENEKEEEEIVIQRAEIEQKEEIENEMLFSSQKMEENSEYNNIEYKEENQEEVLAEKTDILEQEEEINSQKEVVEEKKEKKGFFSRLVSGLTKTRNSILSGINDVFRGFSSIDDEFYEELEEILVMADIGIVTVGKILDDLKKKVKEQKIKEPEKCRQLLIDSIREQMEVNGSAYEFEDKKSVVLFIGVNGVGKTTSVGKLAGQLKARNKRVLMAAADTFRAAAIEQLTEWSNRAGVEIIAQKEGSDPAAVVFDALTAAKARNTDVLLCDTAGRLHNKKYLM